MATLTADDLIEALLLAPAGAVFLGRLEGQSRDDVLWWEIPENADLATMGDVISGLQARPTGELLALAVEAAGSNAGPWNPHAPSEVAKALLSAPDRRPLAAAVVERLGTDLAMPFNSATQEWWWSPWPWEVTERFAPLGETEHGSMRAWCTASWEGIWTVSSPAAELADPLVDVWEMDDRTSRWHLTINDSARIYQVAGPEDWERLVTDYRAVGSVEGHWELPNQNQADVGPLEAMAEQRAMRTSIRQFVVPDWNAVATDWDGVHLTWAGFLTTEGLVIDMGSDDVAMLRGWGSERTFWLNPVFSDPEPLERPALTGRINNNTGVDARIDFARRAEDFEWLKYRLGL